MSLPSSPSPPFTSQVRDIEAAVASERAQRSVLGDQIEHERREFSARRAENEAALVWRNATSPFLPLFFFY